MNHWIWFELRYWVVLALFKIGIIQWYHPFRPYYFERAISKDVKPLAFDDAIPAELTP